MNCETCLLRSGEGNALPLARFGEQLLGCASCEVVERSPETRLLVERFAELQRSFRKTEHKMRRFENRCRELEEAMAAEGERVATLEQIQETGMGELEAELRTKLTLIEAQRHAIHLLSVPLLRVGEHSLCVPLIGTLDNERAARLTERLLQAISAMQIRLAIVDLTGLETLDGQTASHLGDLFRAVALLGGSVVITGVQGHVARAMIQEDVNLAGVRVERNLHTALRFSARFERKDSTR